MPRTVQFARVQSVPGPVSFARGAPARVLLPPADRFFLTLESIPGFSLPAVKGKALRSGELACQAGVSPDTLRHYERVGVLPRPQRGANGYRQYDEAAVDRVRLVRRSLAVGFTLEELARILAARERGSPPWQQLRRLAARKLAQLAKRM